MSVEIDQFEEIFEIRKLQRVKEYLSEREAAIPFIEELYYNVTMYFPPPLRCALEVYEWGVPLLHFIIVTGLRHEEADLIFEDFDRGWWKENSGPYYEDLALDMEYGRIAEDV